MHFLKTINLTDSTAFWLADLTPEEFVLWIAIQVTIKYMVTKVM